MTPMAFGSYDDDLTLHEGEGSAPENPGADVTMEDDTMDVARTPMDRAAGGLSERDRTILEFERQWWKYAGAKEQAIRDLFDMSSTRYYQIINTLIDTPEAMAFDPMLVKRLRRMRASRQKQRSARRLGFDAESR
jgi:hypothetical protein